LLAFESIRTKGARNLKELVRENDMNATPKYVRKNVISANVDQDIILFNEEAGYYYATSDVGASIWEALATPMAIQELIDRLTDEYDVDRDVCRLETEHFLERLQKAGLVEAIAA